MDSENDEPARGHRGQSRSAAADGPERKAEPGKLVLRFLKKILIVILLMHAVYIVLTCSFIFLYKFVNPPFLVIQAYRSIGYHWKLEKPIPISINKVPTYIRTMLISVEDSKFYQHHGIDFEAFKRAEAINKIVGKPLYGGSTLTMQVARTLFLVPEKSYVRKYFEIITALELELFLTKNRILELYFSYAEWGKGIFGIQAASLHWYGKGIASISRDQAARLIALLSSPIKYTPYTLNRSGILAERYAYLVNRFIVPASVLPDTLMPPPAPAPLNGLEAFGNTDTMLPPLPAETSQNSIDTSQIQGSTETTPDFAQPSSSNTTLVPGASVSSSTQSGFLSAVEATVTTTTLSPSGATATP
jgi:monofunctional biosynthetic peptidoglycan transglycosylase